MFLGAQANSDSKWVSKNKKTKDNSSVQERIIGSKKNNFY